MTAEGEHSAETCRREGATPGGATEAGVGWRKPSEGS
jgi:hypothetical protein